MIEATKISNDNMRKMVEWSTEATRTETEYLDKKIDHSLKINTIYLHHIAKNTQPKEEEQKPKRQTCKLRGSVSASKELLQNAVTATGSMLAELKGFAEISSLGVSRVAAGDALTRRVTESVHLWTRRSAQAEKTIQPFSGFFPPRSLWSRATPHVPARQLTS